MNQALQRTHSVRGPLQPETFARKGVPIALVLDMKNPMHPHPGPFERLTRVLPHAGGTLLLLLLWTLTGTQATGAADFPKVFNTQEETIPLVPAQESSP